MSTNVQTATPTILWSPTPTSIPSGTALASSQLNAIAYNNGGQQMAGTFVYTPALGAVLGVGTQTLSVTFTPNQPGGPYLYLNATATATITVTPPNMGTVVTWSPSSPIYYGTALSNDQLNATANVSGSFVYTPAIGTILTAGPQTLSAVFTPSDTNLSPVTVTSSIIVNKALPPVTWTPNPANITYGTPLSGAQLNAVSSIPGTFAYTPVTGTILPSGQNTISSVFTPTDTVNYSTNTINLYINVAQVAPVISWIPNPSTVAYNTPITSAQLDAVANIPGAFTYTPAAGTILQPGTRTLSAVFHPTDSVNFATVTTTASLLVAQPIASLTANQTGASPEYLKYSYGDVTKTDRVNEPCLLDIRLVPSDPSFVKLTRGAYVTLTTATYGIWFTGFITNDPELEFLGSTVVNGVKTPVLGYIYQATSDDFLLNLKPLGIMAPFVNTTQGNIIKTLISSLTPLGWNFDVSGVQDGQAVTRYVVDPAKKFSQVIKEFADPANFQFKIKNQIAVYAQQDANPAGIVVDGSSEHFTPSRLTVKPTNDPIVNDAIVIGDISPQTYFTEYFVGDGITAAFQLVNGVYGVDSTVLLDDDFTDSTIDNTKWTVVDAVNNFLIPSNGFLNVLGGNNTNSFDVYLQSLTLIPLEGSLRLTHGEYDFVTASDGIICSLWSQDCSLGVSNCIYGLSLQKSGTQTVMHPIVGGNIDGTQGIVIDYTKRYNIRTLFECNQAKRVSTPRSYRTKFGTVNNFLPLVVPANVTYTTVITAIDPTIGVVSGQWSFKNTSVPLSGTQTYGYYCPVVSNDLHLTVTGLTVSSPCQAQLAVLPKGGKTIGNIYTSATIIEGFVSDGYGNAVPQTGCWISDYMAVVPGSTLTVGQHDIGNNIYGYGMGFLDAFFKPLSIGVAFPFYAGQVINVPSTAYYCRWSGSDAVSATQTLIQTTITSGYQSRLLGPNETESFDGMSPQATVVDADSGATTRSTVLGAPTYNEGQATLTFFKDSTKQTVETPQVGDMIYLRYRVPGASLGRVQDKTSLAAEATAFHDDGLRSLVVSGLSPLPRTDSDCQLAAAAYVAMNSYQHYEGTYTMPSGSWFTAEPTSGTILQFANLPTSYPQALQAEAVTEVVTTFDHVQRQEWFNHVISYGPINRLAQFLSKLSSQTDVTVIQDTAEIPDFVDISTVGLVTSSPDITNPTLTGWDVNNLYFNANLVPAIRSGLEVRYSDQGWGCDAGRNLVGRFTTSTFSVPRTVRGKVVYVRAYDTRNLIIWSEDLTQGWTRSNLTAVSNVWLKSPSNRYGLITKMTPGTTGGGLIQIITVPTGTAGATFTFSCSISGTVGETITLEMFNGTNAFFTGVTLRSGWQRASVTGVYSTLPGGVVGVQVYGPNSNPVYVTQCSLEEGPSETVYCKTINVPYGALSKYSSGIRGELPLVPPAPTATLALTLPAPVATANPTTTGVPSPIVAPVTTGATASNPSGVTAVTVPSVTLSLVLPTLASDVWGFEVRASDNTTVLYHTDLTSSSYSPYVQFPLGSQRTFAYYCYCYNLLGEYSPALEVGLTIPSPVMTTAVVNDATKTLSWSCSSGTGAILFLVTLWKDAAMTQNVYTGTTTNYQMMLSDQDFFFIRYYSITPTDALGTGTAATGMHEYIPTALVELGPLEVSVILPPANATNPVITVPASFAPYKGAYQALGFTTWQANTTIG